MPRSSRLRHRATIVETYEELQDESVIDAAGWNSDKERTYELHHRSKIVARTPWKADNWKTYALQDGIKN